MGDLEEKLNSILASPEAMGQIMALANSLGGESSSPQEEKTPHTQAKSTAQDMPDLSALLSAFSSNNSNDSNSCEGNPLSNIGNIDPAMISALMTLIAEYNRNDDEKTALLTALKPFLREERWSKVDRAVQITRLSRVIRMALQLFKGEMTDV